MGTGGAEPIRPAISPVDRVTIGEPDTEALAASLAADLRAGDIVLLYGELGAGKTAFVRGLAAGLGVDPAEVSSPTFTLVQRYHGRVPFWHADLYRLRPGEDIEDLGLEELAADGAVVAVEWADRLPRPPVGSVVVRLTDLGDEARRITIGGGRPSPRGDPETPHSAR